MIVRTGINYSEFFSFRKQAVDYTAVGVYSNTTFSVGAILRWN